MYILRYNLLLIVLLLPLSLLWGCGGNGDEPQPAPTPPIEEETTNGYVIYEAFPGLFGTSQSLVNLTAQLNRIDRLEANVLWLMPIYEQGVLKGVGSPYCVRNYRTVKSSYGTVADVKSLVTAAHARGMKVILDWVGNHTSWDHAWITEHPDWYTHDANGNIISPPGMGWGDVADLNYNNTDMRAAMQEEMAFWITEADIDGFRCDYADGVPEDFWRNTISALRTIKGGELLMLAESSNATLYNVGFDMIYAWNFAYRLQDLYGGKISVADLYSASAAELSSVGKGKMLMRHITNHDMASSASPVVTYGSAEGSFSAFVATVGMGGCPMIYSSQEIAYPSALSFFSDRNMDWSTQPAYQDKYVKLMTLYRDSPALQHGEVKLYNINGATAVCSYRTSASERILVLVNVTKTAATATLPMERRGDAATNLWTGKSEVIPATVTLEPYGFYIWKINEQ
jgi:hypothetical protein